MLKCRPWPSPGVAPARFDFEALVWEHHDSPGAWHFLRVPAELADEIGERFGCSAAGFGRAGTVMPAIRGDVSLNVLPANVVRALRRR